jgi:23S rRNA G2445 N2-methylase RlmL
VLDAMCGAGTILAEQMQLSRRSDEGKVMVWGGDLDRSALRCAASNLRDLGEARLVRWDARRLPLPDQCVDRIISNPPFGKQLSTPEEIGPLYQRMLIEYDRVLRPDGRAVLLVADAPSLHEAAHAVGWKRTQHYRVRVLGQLASLSVWKK